MRTIIAIPVPHTFDPTPLRLACTLQDVSNRTLANYCGCHEVTICRVLKAKPPFSLELVEKLCDRLNVPIEAVIKESSPQKNLKKY